MNIIVFVLEIGETYGFRYIICTLLICSCLVIGCSSAPLATNPSSPTTLPTKPPTDIPQPTPTAATTKHPELWHEDLTLLEDMLPR